MKKLVLTGAAGRLGSYLREPLSKLADELVSTDLADGIGTLYPGETYVQGIGGALYEECLYDENGQLLNGTLADYLVPMAGETPDIEIGHIESPTAESELGAKGAGEAGTGGAPAAIMNAINDAIAPLGGKVTQQPFTPQRILESIGRI